MSPIILELDPDFRFNEFTQMSPTAESTKKVQLHLSSSILAAAIAVGGSLAMTVILGLVAMAGSAVRGLPADQIPLVLSADPAFPVFCAAAGVASAIAAGYITARATGGALWQHGAMSGVLAVALHATVVGVLGSPLPPLATAVYIGFTLPAMAAGCYLGAPAKK